MTQTEQAIKDIAGREMSASRCRKEFRQAVDDVIWPILRRGAARAQAAKIVSQAIPIKPNGDAVGLVLSGPDGRIEYKASFEGGECIVLMSTSAGAASRVIVGELRENDVDGDLAAFFEAVCG